MVAPLRVNKSLRGRFGFESESPGFLGYDARGARNVPAFASANRCYLQKPDFCFNIP